MGDIQNLVKIKRIEPIPLNKQTHVTTIPEKEKSEDKGFNELFKVMWNEQK